MRRVRCDSWRPMTGAVVEWSRRARVRTRRAVAPCRIGASGLRSSWASIARNSFLRRSASVSSAFNRAASASARSMSARGGGQRSAQHARVAGGIMRRVELAGMPRRGLLVTEDLGSNDG